MQIHSLTLDDFSSTDYFLVGIHAAMEDYRLAYLLNLHLHIKLKRSNFDLDSKHSNGSATYSLFEYNNTSTENNWFLISNRYKAKIKSKNLSLFSESQTFTYLIPEKKRVDYFLKLEGDFTSKTIEKTIEKINILPQIITSYTIKTNELKSKESLIF